MKRVSTAFVGQVSAASSPAIAKPKGRARATKDASTIVHSQAGTNLNGREPPPKHSYSLLLHLVRLNGGQCRSALTR
jgi:hypothetical protein